MTSEGIDTERGYVRAMFELMGRTVSATEQHGRDWAGGQPRDEAEAALRRVRWQVVSEIENLEPPGSLAEFHTEYVALLGERLRMEEAWIHQGGRRRRPSTDYAGQNRMIELTRVLFAVATDQDVAAAGLPAEHRWRFIAEEPGAPQEHVIIVDGEERDWRAKIRAEMERRGFPERDIEDVLRRMERLRGGDD